MDTARELIAQMAQGRITCEAVLLHFLDAIEQTDAKIRAWTYVDRDGALEQARRMDERRTKGKTLGILHGLPVGLKDIVDTRDMPTERGTAIHAGRQPQKNAIIVDRLLEQGAVIVGKTVTTELAWMNESHTLNPHDLTRTPGGSSSGSAAAVAAGQIPVAVGTQTGGSVIRPASFNGVYGYKPSRGILPRSGVMQTSPTLDQIGVFARDAGDVALLTDAMKGYDAADTMSYLAPRPGLLSGFESDIPVEPQLAWIDMPYRDRYTDELTAACEELVATISAGPSSIDRIPAPQSFSALIECHKVIYDYEIFRSLNKQWSGHKSQLSSTAREGLERAQLRSDDDYAEAVTVMQAANEWFETFFHDYDAIVTPSAMGVAPPAGTGTGDPTNCVIWTLCGLPCLSLPILSGEDNLPMGVQLVGSHDQDDRLLRTARWLISQLTNPA
ncbi:MAG: amidase [Granulosicoccus sp.]